MQHELVQPGSTGAKKPTGPPRLDAAQAARCVADYLAAWNAPEPARRQQLLVRLLTHNCAYCDPARQATGRAAIADYTADVHSRYPGARIVRSSGLDLHHHVCRFHWRLVKADGAQLAENLDCIESASNGRIRRVTGFFGSLAPDAGKP